MLKAALETFAELGYAGASTREISRRADVAEVEVYRQFDNKAGLFDEAVLDPFEAFIDATTTRWAGHRAKEKPLEEVMHEYIGLLYGFFDDNRQVVDALLAAKAHHPAATERLNKLFARLQNLVRDVTVEFGLPVRNLALTTQLSFGLIMSAAVHVDMLFSEGHRLSRDPLVAALSDYMRHGTRPDAAH